MADTPLQLSSPLGEWFQDCTCCCFFSAPLDPEMPRLLPDEVPRSPTLDHVEKEPGWGHRLSGPSWRPMSRDSPGWPVVLWIKDDSVYGLFLYVFSFLF